MPALLYLYAEPLTWPDGQLVPPAHISAHRQEIDQFAERVAGDEVRFVSLSCSDLLQVWTQAESATVREHAMAVEAIFSPGSFRLLPR